MSWSKERKLLLQGGEMYGVKTSLTKHWLVSSQLKEVVC